MGNVLMVLWMVDKILHRSTEETKGESIRELKDVWIRKAVIYDEGVSG